MGGMGTVYIFWCFTSGEDWLFPYPAVILSIPPDRRPCVLYQLGASWGPVWHPGPCQLLGHPIFSTGELDIHGKNLKHG